MTSQLIVPALILLTCAAAIVVVKPNLRTRECLKTSTYVRNATKYYCRNQDLGLCYQHYCKKTIEICRRCEFNRRSSCSLTFTGLRQTANASYGVTNFDTKRPRFPALRNRRPDAARPTTLGARGHGADVLETQNPPASHKSASTADFDTRDIFRPRRRSDNPNAPKDAHCPQVSSKKKFFPLTQREPAPPPSPPTSKNA